jgi:hypothetical protein
LEITAAQVQQMDRLTPPVVVVAALAQWEQVAPTLTVVMVALGKQQPSAEHL